MLAPDAFGAENNALAGTQNRVAKTNVLERGEMGLYDRFPAEGLQPVNRKEWTDEMFASWRRHEAALRRMDRSDDYFFERMNRLERQLRKQTMNYKNFLKTAFAAIGTGGAAALLDVIHTHHTGEPLDVRYLGNVALVGAVFGLANLFMHPPGAASVTTAETVTVSKPGQGSATATSTVKSKA